MWWSVNSHSDLIASSFCVCISLSLPFFWGMNHGLAWVVVICVHVWSFLLDSELLADRARLGQPPSMDPWPSKAPRAGSSGKISMWFQYALCTRDCSAWVALHTGCRGAGDTGLTHSGWGSFPLWGPRVRLPGVTDQWRRENETTVAQLARKPTTDPQQAQEFYTLGRAGAQLQPHRGQGLANEP